LPRDERERERELSRTRGEYRFHPDGLRDTCSFLFLLVSYETVDNPLFLIKERYIPIHTESSEKSFLAETFSTESSSFCHPIKREPLRKDQYAGAAKERKRDREGPRKLEERDGGEEVAERDQNPGIPAFFFFYRDIPPRFEEVGSGTI